MSFFMSSRTKHSNDRVKFAVDSREAVKRQIAQARDIISLDSDSEDEITGSTRSQVLAARPRPRPVASSKIAKPSFQSDTNISPDNANKKPLFTSAAAKQCMANSANLFGSVTSRNADETWNSQSLTHAGRFAPFPDRIPQKRPLEDPTDAPTNFLRPSHRKKLHTSPKDDRARLPSRNGASNSQHNSNEISKISDNDDSRDDNRGAGESAQQKVSQLVRPGDKSEKTNSSTASGSSPQHSEMTGQDIETIFTENDSTQKAPSSPKLSQELCRVPSSLDRRTSNPFLRGAVDRPRTQDRKLSRSLVTSITPVVDPIVRLVPSVTLSGDLSTHSCYTLPKDAPTELVQAPISILSDLEFPLQGDPNHFDHSSSLDRVSPKLKQLLVEKSRLKERVSDLVTLLDVCEVLAQARVRGSVDKNNSIDVKHLSRFAHAVLIDKRSGCTARSKLSVYKRKLETDLKDSFGRVDQRLVERELQSILGLQFLNLLRSQLVDDEARLRAITAEADKEKKQVAKVRSKPAKRDKAVKEQRAPVRRQIKVPGSSMANESKADTIRNLLSSHDEYSEALRMSSQQSADSLEIDTRIISSDTESDEDEDCGGLQNPSQRNVFRSTVPSRTSNAPAQRIDYGLLRQMQARKEVRERTEEQGRHHMATNNGCDVNTDQPAVDNNDEHTENGKDFNDSHMDYEAPATTVSCYRYKLFANISGISADLDTDIHVVGTFLHCRNAQAEAAGLAQQIRQFWLDSETDGKTPTSTIETNNSEEFDHRFLIGNDHSRGFRLWIERERFHPTLRSYRKPKVYQACHIPHHWYVTWTKTRQPRSSSPQSANDSCSQNAYSRTQSPAETHESKSSKRDGQLEAPTEEGTEIEPEPISDLDSLFESPKDDADESLEQTSSPGSHGHGQSGPEQVIQNIDWDTVRFYRCLAMANQYAKTTFMQWFIKNSPGSRNIDLIAEKDHVLQLEVHEIHDRTAWERTETLETPKDEQGRVWIETFEVRVRKASIVGPSN